MSKNHFSMRLSEATGAAVQASDDSEGYARVEALTESVKRATAPKWLVARDPGWSTPHLMSDRQPKPRQIAVENVHHGQPSENLLYPNLTRPASARHVGPYRHADASICSTENRLNCKAPEAPLGPISMLADRFPIHAISSHRRCTRDQPETALPNSATEPACREHPCTSSACRWPSCRCGHSNAM